MTIDKKKLVELLVEKTSMNSEEVEAQLDQLIERILEAAKRGKALEIKEFGVFYFDEGGELRFDPADELSTEISFKYAGMKPVELKPERDTSISDIEEDEDVEYEDDEYDEEEDPFVTPFDEPDLDEEWVKESDVEPKEEFESELEFDEEDDFPFDFDDDSDEEKDAGESIIGDPFSSEALEPLEEPVEKEEDRTKIEDIKPVSRQPVKKKDNTGLFILIAIIVIAVLIGGYFYYVGTQSQSSTEMSQSSTAEMQSGIDENNNAGTDELQSTDSQMNGQETTPNQQTTSNNQSATEQPESNQSTEEEIVSNSGVVASQTDQAVYGLTGSVIEEANDGYSIVVHSFRTEEMAMQAADQLRADGYRVMVTSRTVYENLVWRVSVGQFETLGAAQQATTRLPEPYSTQNFIQRIRTN